ncbi:MAG: efflux RND transporter periplasmic adaptor subunit [Coriobacteriia bacterium]|nr:efflux RND transporter periplasmic adaptor subunit [Coriobacteriia bacterium]
MALSKKLRRYRGWIAAAVLVAVAGTAYAVTRGAGSEETTVSYTTEAASIGTISVTVSETGNVEVGETTEVWADSVGTVASIAVKEGSAVSTGTVLFTLDASDAEANTAKTYTSYLQAKQSVLNAEAQVLKAENDLTAVTDRSELPTPTATADDVAVAEKSVEAAEAGLSASKSSRSSAYTTYEDAKAAESDLAVTSPCSGTVYSLDIEVGDTVAASGGSTSQTVSTSGATSASSSSSSSSAPVIVLNGTALVVKLTVNEVDLPTLKVGQRADVEFDALPDLTATGKVYDISDEGLNTQGVVTFDVYIALDVVDDALRPAMSAAATIVTDIAKGALLVPNAAVQSDGDGGYYVQVLDSTGANPQKITVEVGLMSATQTQVLSGILEGDKVITQTLDSATESDDNGGGFMMPGMGGGSRG